LRTYIEHDILERAEFATKVQKSNVINVPWDSLETESLRRKFLVNPEAFSHLKTLDPMRMSPHEVYSVLGLLLQGQDSGVRLLEFSIRDGPDYDVDAEPESGDS